MGARVNELLSTGMKSSCFHPSRSLQGPWCDPKIVEIFQHGGCADAAKDNVGMADPVRWFMHVHALGWKFLQLVQVRIKYCMNRSISLAQINSSKCRGPTPNFCEVSKPYTSSFLIEKLEDEHLDTRRLLLLW